MSEKKILIVDDKPEIVELIKTLLEHAGYQTLVLNDSAHVIEIMKEKMPDLVLLDIMMPNKDGYQVCDEIRCDDKIKHTPVIVLTGKPLEQELIDEAHQFYGATDYILKPFENEDLLEKVRKYINK